MTIDMIRADEHEFEPSARGEHRGGTKARAMSCANKEQSSDLDENGESNAEARHKASPEHSNTQEKGMVRKCA